MQRIENIEKKVLTGGRVTPGDASFLSSLPERDAMDLFAAANRIRQHFRKNVVDLCAIVNAKSGKCPEDCAFCAQSAKNSAEITPYALLEKTEVMENAARAKEGGAKRFCIVTSGRRVSPRELTAIADMVSSVRAIGMLPCATLGLLGREDLECLKGAGLERYHNNLETSERYFSRVCTTHSWREKTETIRNASSLDISVCSGGIFGIGEAWEDRIDMAFALSELGPDSVPLNFLSPIPGTRLGRSKPLAPLEALKIISIYRFILPDRQIRVCGGRLQTLGDLHPFIFFAGADGLLVGNYLTTCGRGFREDLDLVRHLGLETA